MIDPGRRDLAPDRLRQLLDAVLEADQADLPTMAREGFSSPYHFTRVVRRGTGEPPVAMRRRVEMERAAWRIRGGISVTDAAWEAGYESVEGFARAYARAWGYPPSATPAGGGQTAHWLPAPNGIHFHSPTALWASTDASTLEPGPPGWPISLLVQHDLADTEHLLQAARTLDRADWERCQLPGMILMHWVGAEESLAQLLNHLVGGLECWLASIEGTEPVPRGDLESADRLLERLAHCGPRWVDVWREVAHRGQWDDRIIDALCDPPESFVLGSILGHVLTFNAQRRGLVRGLLRRDGLIAPEDDGDPIMWLREA